MKITSLWDKLPQDIEFRIYGHVLAKRLSLSSHDKYMLMMLLDSQFCIHGHVLAKRLSLHRHDKHTLKMLASEGCILDPRTLFDALRRLAAHLGSPMDEPGEDEDFGCVSYEMPGEDDDCEWDQSDRHRLFRLDDYHNVHVHDILRFARPMNRTKPETRLWLLEALDLAEDREFYSNASLRALEFFGASPRDLRRRGGAREALRQQEEWDRIEERDRFEDDVPPAHRVRCKKLEYARERDWR